MFDPTSFDLWETANRDFRFAQVSACGSPTFLAMREMLYAWSERYKRVVHKFEPNVHEEFQRSFSAALNGQMASARRLLEAHIAEPGARCRSGHLRNRQAHHAFIRVLRRLVYEASMPPNPTFKASWTVALIPPRPHSSGRLTKLRDATALRRRSSSGM